jgi:DNA-binding NtrC family response regulator
MKNILLVFEHSIEFDFIRVVLTTLGFNTFSLHKNPEVRSKIKKSSPDLVLTSILATKDDILKELLERRAETGLPKFVWVGTQQQYKKLSPAQMQVIDGTLPTPIQPDKLIMIVCELLNIPSKDLIKKYHEIQTKSAQPDVKQGMIFVSDKERRNRYAEALTRVESLDRVLSLKEITKGQPNQTEKANSIDLLEKKKDFVKALFGKK